MSYCSVSHWNSTDKWNDDFETIAREKYVPLIISAGASRVQMVRTGDLSFCVVTEYADAATAESAQARIAEIRSQAADELPMSIASVHAGGVFANG